LGQDCWDRKAGEDSWDSTVKTVNKRTDGQKMPTRTGKLGKNN
jgi:hypothetical protein